MKKSVIYLLVLMMAISPAAVFADVEAAADQETAVEAAAEKSGCTIEITGHWGLPAFVQKYRHRSGLLVGAALGTAFCICMSGFIWNINIIAPDGISEYEIRR